MRTIMDLDNFTYTDKNGVVYDCKKMVEISKAYEIMCTAEYLAEVYDISVDEAFNTAEEIREAMSDICECESNLISEFEDDRGWKRVY